LQLFDIFVFCAEKFLSQQKNMTKNLKEINDFMQIYKEIKYQIEQKHKQEKAVL